MAYDKRQRTQNMEEQYDQDCYCGHYTHLDWWSSVLGADNGLLHKFHANI